MEERKYYLYMMAERQSRINQNNQRMEMLQFTLDHDENYQKYTSLVRRLKMVLEQHHKKEISKESEYLMYRDRKAIIEYSNEIQAMVEEIAVKKEQMEMLQMILDQFEKKGKMNLFTVSIKYYKKANKRNREELGEKTHLFPTISKFYQMYRFIKHHKNHDLEYPNAVSLMKQYQAELSVLEETLATKETKLEEVRRILRVYPKQKKELESVRKQFQNCLSFAEQQLEVIEAQRKPIQDEIAALTAFNQQYRSQYSKLKEFYMDSPSEMNEKSSIIQFQKYKKTS